MWPFKKKRKIVGYITNFPTITWYRKLVRDEITREEWSRLPAEELKTQRTPIYEDED